MSASSAPASTARIFVGRDEELTTLAARLDDALGGHGSLVTLVGEPGIGKTRTVVLEGYGATECSPVIACNLPNDNRAGTVGPPLPGIETRLEPVEGITEGGRLLIRGPNVMAGYILPDHPGVLVPPAEGWHDTGDIVTLDDGFIQIRGRAKRFAKIGGEMVSLSAVEALASEVWPASGFVAVALPDARKGERIVLMTADTNVTRELFLRHARGKGAPELVVPAEIMLVDRLPLLGSGKPDFAAALAVAKEKAAAASVASKPAA